MDGKKDTVTMLRTSAVVLLAMLAGQALAQPPARYRPTPFAEVAERHFDRWDADGDGTLSPVELDRLVVSAEPKGEEAAALAAMKLAVRSSKVKPPVLTRDFVVNRSMEPAGEILDSEREGGDSRANTRPPSSLHRRYESAARKVRAGTRELFTDDTPDVGRARQGSLGDCFLIAAIGAVAHRDPQDIKQMIKVSGKGDSILYTVEFPNGKLVKIEPLTDAQLALTSTSGGDGAWLQVLEKAYGTLMTERRPASRRTLEPTDVLAGGGSLSTALAALTGRSIDRISLRSRAEKGDAAAAASRVRAAMREAVKDRRLMGANTGGDSLPPGINIRHAYAVLGFDAEADTVKLWNPHGNSFRPRGEAGMDRGYPTRGGVFEMPVEHFVRVFSSIVIESERAG